MPGDRTPKVSLHGAGLRECKQVPPGRQRMPAVGRSHPELRAAENVANQATTALQFSGPANLSICRDKQNKP